MIDFQEQPVNDSETKPVSTQELIKDIVRFVDKKELVKANWQVIRPALDKAAQDNNSGWDDGLIKALEIVVERLLLA